LHESLLGKSIHETVKILLLRNEIKLAEKLRAEYKVPDRRYWWLRIQCLADQGLWSELEKFSKSKKSPIGYEPFIDQCLKYRKDIEAKKYLPRIREELKVKYLMKLNMLLEAAETALEQKDLSTLTFIQSRCTDRILQEKLNAMMGSLRGKK